MAFPQVNIVQVVNNAVLAQAGSDYYSGLCLYGTAPTVTGKWATYSGTVTPTIKAQQLFALSDATSAGILPYTDNTAAVGTFTMTTKETTGKTVNVSVVLPIANSLTETIDLGTYTAITADSNIILQMTAIALLINNGTVTHGFVAVFDGTSKITLTFPKKYGVAPNTGSPIVLTKTDAVFTQVQPAAGAGGGVLGTISYYAIWYYQIQEFFRLFPSGNLWVGILPVANFDAFNDIRALQAISGNKLRQVGIYDNNATRGSAANITATIKLVDVSSATLDSTAPLVAIYSPNIYSVSDLSTLPDQRLNTAQRTQVVISQDGDYEGALMCIRNGVSVGNIGVKLATIAKSRVSSSDAQAITGFDVSSGYENRTPAFANKSIQASVTINLQTQLHDYGYTFFRQFGDTVTGTYFINNKTCVTESSQYAYVNSNRVFQKISRTLYSTYIPLLNSEIFFNSDGTIKDYAIQSFVDAGISAIEGAMIVGFGNQPLCTLPKNAITIDKTQNVKSTNNLNIVVNYIENGIARTITLNIGKI